MVLHFVLCYGMVWCLILVHYGMCSALMRCISLYAFWVLIVILIWKQIEKIPTNEIKNELKSLGMSEGVIEEMLQVLSVKSLTQLEGWI